MASLVTKKSVLLARLVKNVGDCTKRLSSHFIYYPDNEKPVEGKGIYVFVDHGVTVKYVNVGSYYHVYFFSLFIAHTSCHIYYVRKIKLTRNTVCSWRMCTLPNLTNLHNVFLFTLLNHCLESRLDKHLSFLNKPHHTVQYSIY